MDLFRKLWRGRYSLAAAFWGFYVCGLIATLLLSGMLYHYFYAVGDGRFGLIIRIFAVWSYGLIATVGVWNSAAKRIKSEIWMDRVPGYMARLVVFIYAARVLLLLMNGGALNLMNLLTL